MKKIKNLKIQSFTQLGLLLLIIAVINILSSFFFYRFDITKDKRYSLTDSSLELVKELEDPVLFKVYLEGELPAEYKRLRNETFEILQEFKAYNRDIIVEFIDPNSNTDDRQRRNLHEQLYNNGQGIMPRTINETKAGESKNILVFPGAIVSYQDREIPMQIFIAQQGKPENIQINNSIQQLEYTIASTLKKLTVRKKKTVAFTRGHGELTPFEISSAATALMEFYDVDLVNLNMQGHKLFEENLKDGSLKNKYDALIIAKPDSFFQEKDRFLIDQYIMNGGKILWLVDPIYASLDSLQNKGQTLGMRLNLGLNEQLFRYGVRLNTDLIKDLRCLTLPFNTQPRGATPKYELRPWLFSPVISPASDHPIVNNLDFLRSEFISSLDTVKAPGIKKTILLSTSKTAKTESSPVPIDIGIMLNQPNTQLFTKSNLPVAVLLEGQFNSFWQNRFSPNQNNEVRAKEVSVPTKMIVATDGDLIKNMARLDASGNRVPLKLGFDKYMSYQFGNNDFILNSINYLLDDEEILSSRNKKIIVRPLDTEKIGDKKTRTKFQIINVAVPIFLLFVIGFVIIWMKRRRFSVKIN